MRNPLLATIGAALILSAASLGAQEQAKAGAQDQPKAPTTVELTGCVGLTPSSGGQFTFTDGTSGGTYRLNGKGLKKYAGQRVRIVGDTASKKLHVKTGLWPSPNIAAQAGALDPAQESIARNSGGASSVPDATPELRVVRVNGVEGACR
jgi:hypothetical protein